jgi:phosphate transport system substrate-binding protein
MLATIKRSAVAAVVAGLGFVSTAAAEVRIQGAGATFPNPVYQRWVTEYQKSNPTVKIDYQSIGSGGGIKGITEKTVDFAGSDAPMNKKEKEAAGGEVVHIPTVAGAVVAAYNLPGFSGELKLSGPVLTEIFQGKITNWNDAKIAALNSGATLPDLAITPAYRTDGSGTTFVFTSYLSTQSEDFKGSVGMAKQVKWPTGQGGKGNEGVTAIVQGTPGSVGYVELNYATANNIPFALLQNKAGKFVKASAESVSAAGADAVDQMAKTLAVDIWNQPGEAAYPIAAFTYVVVYKDLAYVKDQGKATELVKFLNWATSGEGQTIAATLDYAPLAKPVQAKVAEAVKGLTFGGTEIKVAAAQ